MRDRCYDCRKVISEKTRHPNLEVGTAEGRWHFCQKCGEKVGKNYFKDKNKNKSKDK